LQSTPNAHRTKREQSMPLSLSQKLEILADAAKYDASCASSGAPKRTARNGGIGSTGKSHLSRIYAGWTLYLALESLADKFLHL
jgi:hypothetical protein